MAVDFRYFNNEASFLPKAERALASHFNSPQAFSGFYAALRTPERKTEFLRTCTFYYYMVKQGDWVVTAPDSNPVIDYFTNSYKVVGIFALIEGLSDETHQDFYDWLLHQEQSVTFPIPDRAALDALYAKYKLTFGAIRRCVRFFERLPQPRLKQLCDAVRVNGKPMPSIKKLAEHLYRLRSEFVHEGRLVVQLSGSSLHFEGKRAVRTEFSMPLLQTVFEEGVLAHFGET